MKKYDVYGIGNAIVDIVTEVDNEFFDKNNVEKGVMTLVDEKRQLELDEGHRHEKKQNDRWRFCSQHRCSGQSVWREKVSIHCLVAKDDFGKFFLEDLKS